MNSSLAQLFLIAMIYGFDHQQWKLILKVTANDSFLTRTVYIAHNYSVLKSRISSRNGTHIMISFITFSFRR